MKKKIIPEIREAVKYYGRWLKRPRSQLGDAIFGQRHNNLSTKKNECIEFKHIIKLHKWANILKNIYIIGQFWKLLQMNTILKINKEKEIIKNLSWFSICPIFYSAQIVDEGKSFFREFQVNMEVMVKLKPSKQKTLLWNNESRKYHQSKIKPLGGKLVESFIMDGTARWELNLWPVSHQVKWNI